MGRFVTIIESGKLRVGIIDTDDHNPPHVHCRAPGAEAKIEIKTGKVYSSKGFTKHSLEALVREVVKNKDVLLEKWEEFYGK